MFYPFLRTTEDEVACRIAVPIDVLARFIHEEYIEAIKSTPKKAAEDKFIIQEEKQ